MTGKKMFVRSQIGSHGSQVVKTKMYKYNFKNVMIKSFIYVIKKQHILT